jgi:putative addiction module component (TIGR02574 family)
MTVAQIKKNALALAPPERIRLVQDIWDSLAKERDAVHVPEHHERLIDERWAAHRANPRSDIPLAKAKAAVRKHLRRAGKK